MHKAFKYRIYPTKKQERTLISILEECRWLYNKFLEERRDAWASSKKLISLYDQNKELKELRASRTSLKALHSQISQNVAMRVDLAFKAFFRRCKNGEKPGYPRFKGQGQCSSFMYPQDNGAFRFSKDNKRIRLSGVDSVVVVKHRELEGTAKSCTVTKTATGKWFVTIVCDDVPQHPLETNDAIIGLDAGLSSFATLSNGIKIDNPRFFKTEQRALAKAQRNLSKAIKGSKERLARKKIVARVYERITNKRRNFACQTVSMLVKSYDLVAVEDLNIKNMIASGSDKHPKMAKSIYDAAWGDFFQRLVFKAESAGRTVIKVNPAYTSQDCSSCGARQVMKLSERTYKCPSCSLGLDRDINAARNILAVGLHSLGVRSLEAPSL